MRILIAAIALAMLLISVPASAATDPLSEPCTAAQVDDADFVLTADGLNETIPTPTLPSPYPLGLGGEPDPLDFQGQATDVYTVVLDVNPDYLSAMATVRIDWDHTGDIDMDVVNKGNVGESHSFNPLDGNTEQADAGRVKHCQTFEIHIRNYIAGPGDISLSVTTKSLRDF